MQTAMLGEIYDQPRALESILDTYLEADGLSAGFRAQVRKTFDAAPRITIVASGSSRHAGLAGELMLEDLAGIDTDVEYASEYSARSQRPAAESAVVAISQSGETADTVAALRVARELGARTFAISNAEHSALARDAFVSMPIMAGLEKAIPATKSFTSQLMALYLLSLAIAAERRAISPDRLARLCAAACALPASLEQSISAWDQAIGTLAPAYAGAQSLLYLGRGVHYSIAREGALKMKESSYVPSEGYPAGELKHGPNALVSPAVPLVILATQDPEDPGSASRYARTLSLVRDLNDQGATILAITNHGDREVAGLASHTIPVPSASEYLLPILEVVPLQLLAFHCAQVNGVDVDRPRNLVKAVVRE